MNIWPGHASVQPRRQAWKPALVLAAILLCLAPHVPLSAQAGPPTGTYRNPILFADYSDPDVIRDGEHYYLVASTFEFFPGIPILESQDLVHWTILGHVLPQLNLGPKYDLVGGNRYGRGVWAPAIRKHNGLFYVYFPTPDEGIFVSTAAKITGPWTEPVAVISGPGYEDPCPFWDDDGQAYLIHSRTGAGPLILHRMSADGLHMLDDGKEIVRDPQQLPTLEGPKLYKRNGFYYIFAPFGGVSTGSQAVLRSKSLYGPYEHRVVLAQGTTTINGPHQGGYVETPNGEAWFVHFQSRGAHGRIVHLEPVRWSDDWPVIGEAPPGATQGQPVSSGPVPSHVGGPFTAHPQTSDEFSGARLGPQWEWNHDPLPAHWSLQARPGFLRLMPNLATDLFDARNTLTQMMQDQSLEFTTRLELKGMRDGVHTGLAMFEKSASGLRLVEDHGVRRLAFFHLQEDTPGPVIHGNWLELRVRIEGDQATYFYRTENAKDFDQLGPTVPITFSWWKGARPALFAYTTEAGGETGFIDFDWAHYRPLEISLPN